MIQAVITSVPSQVFKVDRLVKHCRDLDGTVVKVIKVDDSKFTTTCPQNEFACKQAYSLRCAALEMKGQPFFWLEHDSIPLRPGWLSRLEAEYVKGGKPFMLSSDSHPPHDLVGGIGIYSGDTHWLVPRDFQKAGWDRWMLDHIKPLIHFTPAIQHSYGSYGHSGVPQAHRFPRDAQMLRPHTEVFHRDAHQDLIPEPVLSFYHTGDIGDIVAALPVIRQLGGGYLIIGDQTAAGPTPREPMRGCRYEAIAPLLKQVPYLASVAYSEVKPLVDYDFSNFRQTPILPDQNLAQRQAAHFGITELDLAPWLEVAPVAASRGKVLIARSPRYHNPKFDWKRCLADNRGKTLFVGLQDEYGAFVRKFGHIPYHRTDNLLQVAELIAGCGLFVGNQSAPMWLAMAMGHELIQESMPQFPDSVVPRPNARFVFDGTPGAGVK